MNSGYQQPSYDHQPSSYDPYPPKHQNSYRKKSYKPVKLPQPDKKKVSTASFRTNFDKISIMQMKIISIDKGFYVAGGTQAFGKFKSIKGCMKACANSPSCFAGDYNPWLGKCYFHSNQTACGSLKSHKKVVHFQKVPCCE